MPLCLSAVVACAAECGASCVSGHRLHAPKPPAMATVTRWQARTPCASRQVAPCMGAMRPLHRVAVVSAAAPSPSTGAYAAVQASEASLDKVLSQFNARGKRKKPLPEASTAAAAPGKGQQAAPGGGKVKKQQQQQAGRGSSAGATASSGAGTKPPPFTGQFRRNFAAEQGQDLDRNTLNVGKLVGEVEASTSRSRGKEQRRQEDEDDVVDEARMGHAAEPHAPPAGKTKSSRYGPRNTPRGFGVAPSPASIAAGISHAADAASAHDRTAAGGAASTSAPSSRGSAPSGKAPLRVFLYGTDEATALAAVADAGLGSRVVLVADPRSCDCVLSAKLTRTGRKIKHPQGERTAANQKVPFINVGRNMTGPNLKAALRALLAPGTTPATADTSRQEMTREAAAAAVNAARITGNYFPAPQKLQHTGGFI
jgi:hypothetical protein